MIGCAIERVGTWCRYVALNKRALEDAELFAKIGRIRTPSPPALSDEGLDVVDLYVCLRGKCVMLNYDTSGVFSL